ncbi:hypothetical protein GUJ93_ZPchr0004g39177 [Zizania palustris]|uniref:Uncharacterized protein n=1 Tax=Zizania palustris TaxID=103762 RepID=A0A8J5VZL1_ZIZPA|nr:hypothetical protein GUJ93_ZPchr0004g39177 [Zizania palustris]
MALPASGFGLIRFLSPRLHVQTTDITAAATWGVAAGSTAIYLVQVRVVDSQVTTPFMPRQFVMASFRVVSHGLIGRFTCPISVRVWFLWIGSVAFVRLVLGLDRS